MTKPTPAMVLPGEAVWSRLESKAEIRAWEGGAAYRADLDGRPCFAIDQTAIADFMGEVDRDTGFYAVHVFESVEDRDASVLQWERLLIRHDRERVIVEALRAGEIGYEEFHAELAKLDAEP